MDHLTLYIYPDLMMRIRINDEIDRRFIWRYLNSEGARRYFRERATGTAGNMPKINSETVRSLIIPFPQT
jgi:type I restriction enzyme, S subunit